MSQAELLWIYFAALFYKIASAFLLGAIWWFFWTHGGIGIRFFGDYLPSVWTHINYADTVALLIVYYLFVGLINELSQVFSSKSK